jgi:hypothetical protein
MMKAKKNAHAVAMGRLGGAAGKGSKARAKAARNAAQVRWRAARKEKV